MTALIRQVGSNQRRDRQSKAYEGNVLWDFYKKDGDRAHSWMFPFYTYNNQGPIENALAPGAEARIYGTSFWCLPFCWYDNQASVHQEPGPAAMQDSRSRRVPSATNDVTVLRTRKNGCFPLWRYASSSTVGSPQRETSASLLLLLYDYKRDVRAKPPTDFLGTDYTRTRVLWRLWHYERSDDDVSVDIFPAITYDRKGGDFKKVTFLWRFFRYERGKDGRKLDLLFVPIVREMKAAP